MKSMMNVFFYCAILLAAIGCGKDDNGSGPSVTDPSDLVVNANISTDGSGNVAFKATATNAVSYVYEFGNGETQTVPSGIINYTYTLTGSNTYNVKVTATGSSGKTISKTVSIVVYVSVAGGTLVWSDEFNTDGPPDPAKWSYEIGTGSGGWGNNELQYYTNRPENSIVQGGVLKVKAIKENFNGSNYTSARLITKNKYAFTYGKVDVRAKMAAGGGTWPAVWMLGSNINAAGWPACGEIDIVEHVGNQLNKIYGTLHYPGRSGGNADGATRIIDNATTEFHLYTVEWKQATIKIYVDNQLYHNVVNTAALPFNQDFFLLVNLAMGGNFGGVVDPAFTNATLEVDYIRVYK